MSENEIEFVLSATDSSRRVFLGRLLAGAAFVAPAVASFTIGRGSSASGRVPFANAVASNVIDIGSNTPVQYPSCGPNTVFYAIDVNTGSNIYFDISANTLCVIDGGSNDLDGGSNTPVDEVLPPTK